MKGRKTTMGGFRKKSVKDKVLAYLNNPEKAADFYGEGLDKYLIANHLDTFFHHLHQHLTQEMLIN